VQLLASATPGDDEAGLFQQLQVLHDAEAGHGETFFQLRESLTVLFKELVEEGPASRVSQSFEDVVHCWNICDYLVTCQGELPLLGQSWLAITTTL
jgi:hypothetical protein